MVVYICTKFHENILNGIKVNTDFHVGKISKEHNSINIGRVMILFLCTLSDGGVYLYKVHENILDGIKVIEQTGFS